MPLLSIDIEAHYAKFVDAMATIERTAKKSAKSIQGAFSSANTALAGLGVGLSVAGLVAIVKNAVDAADHLNDLSKQTGIAVDVIGGLGFASAQAGGNLESIAGAAGKLNKSIAEAAAGNKEFSVAFQKLGIDVRDANGALKSADKVMVELANKFEGFADGPEKVAIAMRLLGKTGADQIALLNDGGRALQANIELYRRYAGVTQETANKADAFNDNLEKLHLISGAFGRQLAAELLPALEGVSTELLRAKERGEGFKSWAESAAGAVKFLGLAVVDTGKTLESYGIRIGGIVAQTKALAGLDFSKFLQESAKVRQKLDEMNDSYGRMQGAIRNGKATNPFDQVFNIVEGNIGQDKKLMESRVQLLQKYNNEGLLSDKDFYAGREAAQHEYIEATKRNIGAEIGILKEKAKRTKDANELEAINAQISDLALKRETVGAEKPRAPTLPGNGPDGGVQKLEGQLKALERASEREKEMLSSRSDFLQTFYDQDLISIRDYYAARKAASDEALQAQTQNIDKEIALLESRRAKDADEQEKNQAKIQELKDRKAQLEQAANRDGIKSFVEQNARAEQLARTIADINTQLLEQQGLSGEAAARRFDEQNRQLRQRLQTELASAQKAGDSPAATTATRALNNLDALKNIATAQGKINELQEIGARIQSDLSIASDRAQIAAENGSITELESLRQISDARAQSVVDLQAVATAYAQMAAQTGNPAIVQRAKEMQVEVEKLAASADLVRAKFQDTFSTGFESFFDKLTSGTATIRDAFKAMFQDITSEINKMVARDLSKELFGKGGGLGGVVDFASEIFGGKAKIPDSASAAAASVAKVAGESPEIAAAAASAAALTSLATVTAAADGSLVTLATTTLAVDTALTTLAASALTASAAMSAVAAKGAGDSASGIFDLFKAAAASAKGNIFVGGGIVPFAKGGAPDIVNTPRYFPMAGGKTGLMGEAGPEAIMPLVRDHEGKLAVRMLGERGAIGTLQLGRDASGRLAVRAANDSSVQKFATGGVFGGLSPNFKTNASSIQMPSVQSMSMTPGAGAERIAVVDGGIKSQQINVNVPAGTPQESASQIAARTAMAITRSSRRNN